MQVFTCFSQNKDELVIGFNKDEREVYIRANLLPVISCIAFPVEFKRSRKNTISLFPELLDQIILEIKEFDFERAIRIKFQSGDSLVFKLHGTRSNVLFFPKDQKSPSKLFRNELRDDWNLILDEIPKKIPLTWERFKELEGNASKFLPTLGKIPRAWLQKKGYIDADIVEKWKLMMELLDLLDAPLYYIVKDENEHLLTLLPAENAVFSSSDPIAACNELFRYKVVIQAFEKEKGFWIKSFEEQKKRTRAYLEKTRKKLSELENEASPSQLADVIMANLHLFTTENHVVTLFNFYTQKEIIIELKRGLSPQKFAENLYRKSKNRKKELDKLRSNLLDKELLYSQTENLLEEVKSIKHFRELKEFLKIHQLTHQQKEKEEQVPYKKFEIEEYEVLVGKSAKANDELLRRFAWKEDLWLHAKDVSGSHVLIKFRSGRNIPKTVIERASELAAYYSKHKNEHLAPVIYTPVKYVRKVKGSAPGAVMVDKENVILIKPRGPES